MKNVHELIDTYTDYLIGSTLPVTCTGLSKVLENKVSHDKFTRLLSGMEYSSKDLWGLVKQSVRENESEEGILVFDDTISEKPYTGENPLMGWHYDHTKGRSVKGVNMLTGLYLGDGDVSIPVVYELVEKDVVGKGGKRTSSVGKNERMRRCLDRVLWNGVKFKWVITDIWFGSAQNMSHIKGNGKEFIMPLKGNRLVALSVADRDANRYVPIESLKLEPGDCPRVYLKETPFAVTLIKEEYVNKDMSTASLYLVCSDEKATYQQIITLYQKRWKVEEYHKSLKNNASLAASPTRTVKTQSNHIFMSLLAYCKLEIIKLKNGLNHFAYKAQLYIKAMDIALNELKNKSVGIQLNIDFA